MNLMKLSKGYRLSLLAAVTAGLLQGPLSNAAILDSAQIL